MDPDFECVTVRWHTEVTDTDSVVLLMLVVVVVEVLVGGGQPDANTHK